MKKTAVWEQITSYIKAEIESGRFQLGDKLPTEAALSRQFGTSRTTVVKAMDILATEGILYRMQGKGSFVAGPHPGTFDKNYPGIVSLILPFSEKNAERLNESLLIRGAESSLKVEGYRLVVHFVVDDENEEAKAVLNSRQEGNAGAIIYPTSLRNNLLYLYPLLMEQYPVVFLDNMNDIIPLACVHSDNIGGGRLATRHLIDQGFEELYFVSDVQIDYISSVKERYLGFCLALKDYGIAVSPECCINGFAMNEDQFEPVSFQENPDVYKRIIQEIVMHHPDRAIGIFAVNDSVAVGLIGACAVLNIQVPGKIGVIGFDDENVARMSPVPISTVRQNFHEIGRLAALTVLEKIKGVSGDKVSINVEVELIPRQSTAINA